MDWELQSLHMDTMVVYKHCKHMQTSTGLLGARTLILKYVEIHHILKRHIRVHYKTHKQGIWHVGTDAQGYSISY